MSYKTWVDEFYTPRSFDVGVDKSDAECIAHCITKWEGALPDNTLKHHIIYSCHLIYTPDEPVKNRVNSLIFDGVSCALCHKYSDGCRHPKTELVCPLEQSLGRCCDYDDTAPYAKSQDDPQPMIDALKQAYNFTND